MSESAYFKKLIIVSVLCICPTLGMAGSKGQGNTPSAFTVWGVFFNNPEACEHTPCTDTEFGREGNPAGIDVCYITGTSARRIGWGTLGGHFAEGTYFGCIFSGLGLVDAHAAEIHFVVQRHGYVHLQILTDQVTEFMGGCPWARCLDIHFAVHVPTEDYETVSHVYRFADGSKVEAKDPRAKYPDRMRAATSTLRRMEGGIKVAIRDYFHNWRDFYGMPARD